MFPSSCTLRGLYEGNALQVPITSSNCGASGGEDDRSAPPRNFAAHQSKRFLPMMRFFEGVKQASAALLSMALAAAVLWTDGERHPAWAQGVSGKPDKLSPYAQLGRKMFFDPSLSSSGQLACASCHSPANAYSPPNNLAVQPGGPEMKNAGVRAVPSLRYLENTPKFTIGPASAIPDTGAPAVAAAPPDVKVT